MTSLEHPVDSNSVSSRRPAVGEQCATSTVWTSHEAVKTGSGAGPRAWRARVLLESILVELRSVTEKMRADDERCGCFTQPGHPAVARCNVPLANTLQVLSETIVFHARSHWY